MRLIIPAWNGRAMRRAVLAAAAGLAVAACSSPIELTPAEQPLAKETAELLAKKGMKPETPIFVRIFKEESELEVWKARDDGRFYHLKTYPICHWSGDLGPKLAKGDKQAPEGFYSVAEPQMNPNSKFHVAFNLGFPNAYDKSHGRTGDALMVHGKCRSAGCYAMTDALAEEIYALARESFRGGQPSFQVHAFPFRMTDEKLARFKKHKWYAFWSTLKQGYDSFELTRVPPPVAVCESRYVVNVLAPAVGRVEPMGRCPSFMKPNLEPFSPKPNEWQLASERVTMPGPKTRDVAEVVRTAETKGAIDVATSDQGSASTIFSASGPIPAGASALGFNR